MQHVARARRARLTLLVAFFAVYVFWGSTYLAIRFAVETLPPFLMAGARFLVAGGLLLAWALARGERLPARPALVASAVTGLFLLLGGNGGVVWAEQRVPSGIAALLVAIMPLWMVLLDWLRPRGVRPRPGVFVGLALGTVGLVILVGPDALRGDDVHGGVSPIGALVLILASLSWAAGSIYSRQAPRAESALMANALQMVAGGVALTLLGLAVGETLDLERASARSVWSLVYLIVFGSLVGFTAYTYLLRATTAARVATYAYVNPVIAVLLGWLFASEPISVRTLVAAAVILGGVALITVAGGSPRVSAAPAEPGPAQPGREAA